MRDRDSQLIFENYNKKVLLKEQATGLEPAAVGLAGIGLAEVLGVIAMGVGATALAASIDSLSDRLNRTFNFTRVKKDPFESLKSIIAAQDYSARGNYELINLAKSLDVPAISSLIAMGKSNVELLRKIEDSLVENAEQLPELIDSVFFALKEELSQIRELSAKIKNKDLEKITEALGEKIAPVIEKLEREIEDLKRGGGKKPDDDFWQKIKKLIKMFWMISFRLKVFVIAIGLGIAFVAIGVTGSGESVGWLIGAGLEKGYQGAKATTQGVGQGVGLTTKPSSSPQPKPTPSFKLEAPIKPTSPSSRKKPNPSATPDLYSADL